VVLKHGNPEEAERILGRFAGLCSSNQHARQRTQLIKSVQNADVTLRKIMQRLGGGRGRRIHGNPVTLKHRHFGRH
jgi:hypothetical protein